MQNRVCLIIFYRRRGNYRANEIPLRITVSKFFEKKFLRTSDVDDDVDDVDDDDDDDDNDDVDDDDNVDDDDGVA